MPPSNHTCPPGATTHAPPSNHACPPVQPCTHIPPQSNHTCMPPQSNHTPPKEPCTWPPRTTMHPQEQPHTPPPVDRMTDTCKNITFTNFVFRVVTRSANGNHHLAVALNTSSGGELRLYLGWTGSTI